MRMECWWNDTDRRCWWQVDECVWSVGGMMLSGEVGGRWMKAYGTLADDTDRRKTEILWKRHVQVKLQMNQPTR